MNQWRSTRAKVKSKTGRQSPVSGSLPVRIFVRFLSGEEPQNVPIIHRFPTGPWPQSRHPRCGRSSRPRDNPDSRIPPSLSLLLFLLALASVNTYAQNTNSSAFLNSSSVIEAAGQVEYLSVSRTNWQRATVGVTLQPGDHLRTLAQSRAAVQLSDRSVIRLNERTTLEILPRRREEKRRFGLPRGSIFFFNREKPADIQFDTPLAAGAIRGTEFLLEVADNASSLRLALIDGRVAFQNGAGEIIVEKGEELRLEEGKPPQKTALVNAVGTIQWALYYPAVLNPKELNLRSEERQELRSVLENYLAGDLLAALAAWPAGSQNLSSDANSLHAALLLSVGQVSAAEALLARSTPDSTIAAALRELIATVRGEGVETNSRVPKTSSELLASSYVFQRRSDLPGALAAVRQASVLAPQFGFAHARLAELEFSFGNHRSALAALDRALALSPRLPTAHALRGFILLEQGDTDKALSAFERAREIDAAFGPSWLGRGLCLLRERKFASARAAFQAAAALEPQRALFRAYLGKVSSELGDAPAAEKEFKLAERLDPHDPTSWLYSALHLWEQNRLNEAIRELEISADLNEQRAPFRSRFLLDSDRSVRSANLAALYEDAGFPDVSRHAAARAVAEDYANFSGHLFLANSYQTVEDVNHFDLRLETARKSELLVANLLAPPGAGNLSQQLSQQEHLRFFDPRPLGVSSLTEYASRGDWHQAGTFFGTLDGFSYAFDANYESLNGQRANNDSERKDFSITLKQRVSPDDDAYFQAGYLDAESGDVAARYDPAQAVLGFRARETQEPTLYAGWHHAWSAGSHTLLLVARLEDNLSYTNPQPNVIFFQQPGGTITDVQTAGFFPPFRLDFESRFTLYSAELQHLWETERYSVVIGGRYQSGQVDTRSQLGQEVLFPGLEVFSTNQNLNTTLERGNIYAYGSYQIFEPLRMTAGLSYDRINFPENADFPPISKKEDTRDSISPKAGLLFTPWNRGLLRAYYARSLGGLFFDNSVRLEPTQIAGFNQAFRSLIPESVEGLASGTRFDTAGIGFDQSFIHGTWFGVEAEWLTSEAERSVGVLTNPLPFPLHSLDSASQTQETLKFRERNLSAYAAQLLGDWFSLNARYRVSEGTLTGHFSEVTDAGIDSLEENKRAVLHHVSLGANFNHPSGFFARWESGWFHQTNSRDDSALAGDDFWQHNLLSGYRFPRRYAELTLGVVNLFDTDYRLNPLNPHSELPRGRTFIASLRLNF
jgi:tetratricopeptide (TPR) repeat protein